jgi:hypothetical protein
MTDVLPSPLVNFSLELCFLTHKLSQKKGAYLNDQNWQNCNSSGQTGQAGKPNRSDRSTTLIYMASLIAPLHRAHQVDQFLYLICPNQTPNKKVMGFEKFKIFELKTLPIRPVWKDLIRFKFLKIDLMRVKTFPPYKYRVPRPIEGNQHNRNKSKLSYLYCFSFYPCSTSLYPKFFPNPNLLSFLHPDGDWRCSSRPAGARIHQGAPAPTGSLGQEFIEFLWWPVKKSVWPVVCTDLTGRLIQRPTRLVCSSRMSRWFGVWPDFTSKDIVLA